MLLHLTIKNYALIRELDIDIPEGFVVITGETGAGKSILLGALSLILGQRADISLLSDKKKKCIVEGTFRITGYGMEDVFREKDLDWQEVTIFRRELNPGGTSRAFINDTPVTLTVLKDLGEKLINVHSQYQTLMLNDANFQMTVVDNYAGILDQVGAFRIAFDHLASRKAELDRLTGQENKAKTDLDYYQFLYDELDRAQLTDGEQGEAEQELHLLNNAEEIKSTLYNAAQLLVHDDRNVLGRIKEITTALSRIAGWHHDLPLFISRLEQAGIEIKDIVEEMERLGDHIVHDPDRIALLSERIDLLNKLEHKHHVGSVEELLKIWEDLAEKISSIQTLSDDISRLEKEISGKENALHSQAEEISGKRKEFLPALEKDLLRLLRELGMPDARFSIDCSPSSGLTRDGLDQLTFLFNANRGGEMKEISGIASGGERSRFMLSLKSMIARKNLLPTIIFDEIDIGVSGEVAGKMGYILKQMAQHMQVVVITHLPQIASKGKTHYLVYKESDIFTTQTFIKKLSSEERLQEIAKMLSDQKVSDSAVMAARELLKGG